MCTSASRKGLRAALAAATALAVAGCAVGPNFKRPAPPKADSFGAAQAVAPAGAPEAGSEASLAPRLMIGGRPEAQWWRLFGSDALDALMAEGLKASPTLASAQAALRQSRDQLKAGAGVFLPSLDAGFSPERELTSPAKLGLPGKGSTFSLYTLSGTVNYALDVFGGERRTVEGLKAQAEQQRWAVGSAYLALTGAIADAAIARSAYDAEIVTLTDIVRLDQLQRDVLGIQAQTGVAPLSAALAADQQLAADRESLAAAVQRRDAALHLLAALLGREPGEAEPPAIAFDTLVDPTEIPVSLPSRLVEDRPDIRAAEANLHRAHADVGVATAALFPSVTLSGTSGLNSTTFSSLTAAQSRFWAYGQPVDAPIFHGGQLWFQRRAAQDAWRKAMADYRQTVLAALQQTADGLSAVHADAGSQAAAWAGLDSAVLARKLARDEVSAGVLDAYDASTPAIAVDRGRLAVIEAKAALLQDETALYLASGGGWRGQGADAAKSKSADR